MPAEAGEEGLGREEQHAGGNFAGLYDLDQDLLVSPWFYYGTYRDNACSVRCVRE